MSGRFLGTEVSVIRGECLFLAVTYQMIFAYEKQDLSAVVPAVGTVIYDLRLFG